MLNHCYSQSESVIAYSYKAEDHILILLLDCNVGYSYSGGGFIMQEVFTYEKKGKGIIRTFGEEFSFRQRVDTLKIEKSSLQDVSGITYKKASSNRRDKLIENFIKRAAVTDCYKVFLEGISKCKDD